MKKLATVALLFALLCGQADAGQPTLLSDADVIKNRAAVDGAGLCVAACVETMARHQGVTDMEGFAAWCEKRPGGFYPSKLEKSIAEFCAEKDVEVPEYVQYEGRNVAGFVEACLLFGYPVMTTDNGGKGSRYQAKVASAVVVLEYDATGFRLFDPNFTRAAERYERVSREDFVKRSGANPWCFAWKK